MRVLVLLAVAGVAAAAYKLILVPGHGHHAHPLLTGHELLLAIGVTFVVVIACVLHESTR